jgi:hypothetical protein
VGNNDNAQVTSSGDCQMITKKATVRRAEQTPGVTRAAQARPQNRLLSNQQAEARLELGSGRCQASV